MNAVRVKLLARSLFCLCAHLRFVSLYMLLLLTIIATAAWPAPAPELARPQAALELTNSPARPLDRPAGRPAARPADRPLPQKTTFGEVWGCF